MTRCSTRLVGLLAFPILLVGCANTASVKEVLASPDTHLANFAPNTLSADVMKKLPKGEQPMSFKRIEIQTEVAEVRSDQKVERAVTTKNVIVNAGDGLVHSYDEIRSNEVPFRINFKLTYRGFYPLKVQNVFLNNPNADMLHEVKSVKRFDSLPAVVAQPGPLEYDASTGTQVQIANYRDRKDVCQLGAQKPASELHAALDGQWIELTCDMYGLNGQYSGKSTYAYLLKYGVALQRTYVDSNTRNTMNLKSVKVQ